LIDSLPKNFDNPYSESESIGRIRFGKKEFFGHDLFFYFPKSAFEIFEIVRTPEKDKIWEKLGIVNYVRGCIERVIIQEYPDYSPSKRVMTYKSLEDYLKS
jgi:hypothetical protein